MMKAQSIGRRICIAFFLAALGVPLSVHAAQLATDTFSYFPSTSLSGQGLWGTAEGTAGEVQVIAGGSLAYTDGLSVTLGTGANRIAMAGSPQTEDPWMNFSPDVTTEGNSAYVSFLVKNTTLPPATDYFAAFHPANSNTVRRGRVYARQSGAGYELGVAYGTTGSTTVYNATPTVLMTGTTYMVVLKLTMVAGALNDTCDIWINPNLNQPAEPAAYASASNNSANADLDPVGGIGRFGLRNGTNTGAWEIDEVKVGTTWADVTGSTGPPADSTPPAVAYDAPARGSVAIGTLSSMTVSFNEAVDAVAAGSLTVNSSPATSVTGTLPGPGPFVFTGFSAPLSGTVNVALASGPKDVSNNVFAGDSWSFSLNTASGLLHYDGFNYSNGIALNDTANWGGTALIGQAVIANGDTAGDLGTSSLNYAGLATGANGRVIAPAYTSAGADASTSGVTMLGEGNALYASFLYKPIGAPGATYFAHYRTDGSIQSQLGRVEANPSGANTQFGARLRNALPVLEAGTHPAGATVFLVAKVTMVAGADNDIIELWVNPTPGLAQPAPTVTSTTEAGNDINPATGIRGFTFRFATTAQSFEFDELRLGTTWESVTPSSASSVADWNLYN